MKNWKTTLFGLIGAAGAAMQTSSNHTVSLIGLIIVASGIAGIGAMAKDKNVTGGNTDNNIK